MVEKLAGEPGSSVTLGDVLMVGEGADARAGAPLLAATLFFLLMLGLFSGAQRVAFQMVLGKVIPFSRRGRLQAWRNFTGGIIAAALTYAAGRYIIGGGFFTYWPLDRIGVL